MGVDDMSDPTYSSLNKSLKGRALPSNQVLTKHKTIGVHPIMKVKNRNADVSLKLLGTFKNVDYFAMDQTQTTGPKAQISIKETQTKTLGSDLKFKMRD